MEVTALNEVIELVSKVAPAAQQLFPGCEVYLFGSYAKGCPRVQSDIDVGVLVSNLDSYIEDGTIAQRTMDLWVAADKVDDRMAACVRASDDATGFADVIRETGIKVA